MGGRRRVAVTGVGFISCIGNGREAVVESLRELRHGIVLYPPFQRDEIPVKLAAPVPEFSANGEDPEDWTFPSQYKIRRESLRALPPHGLYAYCATVQALDDAGLNKGEISEPRTGLFAASVGSVSNIHRNLSRILQAGVQRCSPMSIISSVAGTLNFNLVSIFKIKGASAGFVSACSSSGHALGYAFEEIVHNRQERMIVVGAEDGNLESILPFASLRVLSLSTDPQRSSRPFDRDRDGFVGTGGSVAMILESEELARRRGARIYAEFLGWGQASDGYHMVISHPEGNGLHQAMANALSYSGVAAGDVEYVNAHAPSTLAGDLSETRALLRTFRNGRKQPAVSSTKALTGHGLSFASILEAAITVVCIEEGMIPGSAHIERLEPEARELRILRETTEGAPKIALSNSSGFGGANVSLVFGSY